MRILPFLAAPALALAAACGPASLQIAESADSYVINVSRASSPSDGGRVVRETLLATNVPTLLDALNRARPDFLRPTGSIVRAGESDRPVVYLDGRQLGGVEVLGMIQVAEIAEVRLLRPAAARMLFGSGCECAGGVIAVARQGDR